MVCYAVIDTNVLVSALLTSREDAATVQIVRKMITGEVTPVYSKAILQEYREVLRREKFGFSEDAAEMLIAGIVKFGIEIDPDQSMTVLQDMSDLPFYEIVISRPGKDAFLITGNKKHFPAEPFVVTPREMLDILESNND